MSLDSASLFYFLFYNYKIEKNNAFEESELDIELTFPRNDKYSSNVNINLGFYTRL